MWRRYLFSRLHRDHAAIPGVIVTRVDASTPETPEGETTAAPTADPAAAEDCALIEETTNARMASYEETPPTSAEENAAMMEDMGSVMSELSGQVSHPELVTALDQVSTMFAGLGELTAETEELMAQVPR